MRLMDYYPNLALDDEMVFHHRAPPIHVLVFGVPASVVKKRREKLKGSVANVIVFLEKAKEYTQLDTLTAELLHLYYRDIGLLGDLNAQPTESATVPEPQEVA